MYRQMDKAAINRILQSMMLEAADGLGSWELVQAPLCALDLESYELLVKQTGRTGYAEFLTRAVQTLKPIVSDSQLTTVSAAVKKSRRNYRSHTVHTKIGKAECKWIKDTATKLGVRPSRVLEAVVFLYLRAEAPTVSR